MSERLDKAKLEAYASDEYGGDRQAMAVEILELRDRCKKVDGDIEYRDNRYYELWADVVALHSERDQLRAMNERQSDLIGKDAERLREYSDQIVELTRDRDRLRESWFTLLNATGEACHLNALEWINAAKIAESAELQRQMEIDRLTRERDEARAESDGSMETIGKLTRDLGEARELLREFRKTVLNLHPFSFTQMGLMGMCREYDAKFFKPEPPQPATEWVPWDAETRPRGPLVLRKSGQSVCEFSPGWCPSGEKSENSIIPWNDLLDNYEWSRDGKTWEKCGVRK